jgi:Flp pilus assembly protein protease CpaA
MAIEMVIGNLFLIILGFVGIVFAVVQDLKKREIANWLNFSLIIFALVFRFFYSFFGGEGFSFFYQGLIGFGAFFIIGNFLYYSRVFAGGDAKLMIALGAIIPFSENLLVNVNLALIFLFLFLIVGAFYGMFLGGILLIRNKRKFAREFSRQFKSNKKLIYISIILGIVFLVLAFFESIFLYLAILIFITPYLYLSAKSIDESCMVKRINPNNLTEGDWLYDDINLGKRNIKAKWGGLDKDEIVLLRKRGKDVLIREGIPFSPVFLITYLVWVFNFWFDFTGFF